MFLFPHLQFQPHPRPKHVRHRVKDDESCKKDKRTLWMMKMMAGQFVQDHDDAGVVALLFIGLNLEVLWQ